MTTGSPNGELPPCRLPQTLITAGPFFVNRRIALCGRVLKIIVQAIPGRLADVKS